MSYFGISKYTDYASKNGCTLEQAYNHFGEKFPEHEKDRLEFLKNAKYRFLFNSSLDFGLSPE